MGERVRVAMVGAGRHACRVHYPSLAMLDDAEIVAVAELSEERRKGVCTEYGIPAGYEDYRKMLSEVEPDAVYVILPHLPAYPVALDCLKKGFNVFMEKPPGITVAQSQFLARAAEAKGCISMVGFQRRYAPLVREAQRLAAERGGSDLISCRFHKNAWGLNLYEYHETKGVDILTCDAIHAVDLMRCLGGEVVKVASDVRTVHVGCADLFVAVLKFESGATGVFEASWTSGHRVLEFDLHARGLVANVDVEKEMRVYADDKDEPERFSAEAVGGGSAYVVTRGFHAESARFIECVRRGELPETHLGDSVKTMELVDRIYHSVL
jgi:virulence factor